MSAVSANVVLLAGASGLTGSHILDILLNAPDVDRVVAVTRRAVAREHPRLANRIVQFERIGVQLQGLTCAAAVCCLGTTLQQSGSPAAMRAVDVDAVVSFAQVARAARARRFVVVSSVGADPASRNFYLRTKGEMEAAVAAVGFEAVDILQPSLLLGWRNPVRPLELAAMVVATPLAPLLRGRLARYHPLSARTLACAVLGALRSGRRGIQRYGYEGLLALARVGTRGARETLPPRAPPGPGVA